MINFFSGAPKLLLIPEVSPSPNIRKSFLRLSVWDDKLLRTPKITTFLARPLPKIYEPYPSNAIPYQLHTYFSLSSVFIIVVAPKKIQFFNVKFLNGTFGQSSGS